MKPKIHLARVTGIRDWLCYGGNFWDHRTAIGVGKTPKEAYEDWQAQPRKDDCAWMLAGAQ